MTQYDDRDECEKMAAFYDDQLRPELTKLREVLETIVSSDRTMTYSQFLRLKQQFEMVAQTMHRRDIFGVHSNSGRDLYRWIAHPEQFPKPEAATA